MKTASLLLAFPLLLPVCTAFAAPREIRADGQYEFLDGGKKLKYTIAKDEVYRRHPKQGANRIFLSGRKDARGMQAAARQLSEETGDKAEMVAYPTGETPSDDNRRVVSSSVTLKLADGVDAMIVASAVGAQSYRSLFYAPGCYAFKFTDGQTALSAAEDLKKIEGVSEVTVELARKYSNRALPTFTDPYLLYATTGSRGQAVDIWYDFTNQVTLEPGVPWLLNTAFSATNMFNYQWYLNNTGQQMDLTLFYPAFLLGTVGGVKIPDPLPDTYAPDVLPKFAVPNDFCTYNSYFDLTADINAFGAWSQTTLAGDPINGSGVKVAVMDDGVQVNHEDLAGFALYDNNRSYNFANSDGIYDYTNSKYFDPTPVYNAVSKTAPNHGTGVAGIIFGRANNAKGIVGVAYMAKMLGYRFQDGLLEPSIIADMMTWGSTRLNPPNPDDAPTGEEWRKNQPFFDVSVNAWGDSTSGATLNDKDPYFKKSLAYGATAGRDGKGVIYVFPAGNEGDAHGDSNYAYTSNSIYSIHVGAVSDMGRRVIYSSPGASVHVVAPSAGYEMPPAILRGTTVFPPNPLVVPLKDTDRILGYTVSPDDYDAFKGSSRAKTRNSQYVLTTDSAKSASTAPVSAYNKNFSGTSASTAMVGGVVALMLQANPNLGWRDVQEILMRSAKMVDPLYGEWSYNPMGMPVSHKYGAGLVDAGHAVAMAKVWKNLGPRSGTLVDKEWSGEIKPLSGGNIPSPDASKTGLVLNVPSPSGRVEQVVVKLKVKHSRIGDLGIILSAPATGQADGPMESFLFVPHRENSNANIGIPNPNPGTVADEGQFYEFTSVRHWGTASDNPVFRPDSGETSQGWSLKIYDNTSYGKTGAAGVPASPAVDPNSTKLVDGIYVDRVIVPVDNNKEAGVVQVASVTFHGSNNLSENRAPDILQTKIVGRPGKALTVPINARTDTSSMENQTGPRAPMLGYYFKVLGNTEISKPSLFTSPDSLTGYLNAYPEPLEGEPPITNNPSFRFDPRKGVLTTATTPQVIPSYLWVIAQGVNTASTITVNSLEGLHKDMYVVGTGIGRRAQIASINEETHEITLTKPNRGDVRGWIRFTDFGPATGLKGEFTVKMTNISGLQTGMYVLGDAMAAGTRIAGIDTRTNILTLTAANIDDVNDVLFFSDLSYFKNPPLTIHGTGEKNSRRLKLDSFEGLFFRDYVSGKGIAPGARIIQVDQDQEMTVILNVPNTDVVEGDLTFSDVREFEPLVKGRWNVELSATNIFGTTRKQIELEIKDKVKYDEWVNTYYPPITDPNADPDGDGIKNFWEFVSGGDPYVADSYQMPSSAIVDGKLVFGYQVDANAEGVKVIPQISSDLNTWIEVTPVAGTPVGSVTPYTVTQDLADPRKFFRLRVP